MIELDEILIAFFKDAGLDIQNINDLDGYIIHREHLLDDKKYEECMIHIPLFRKIFSSSSMTALQANAEDNQRFPLINILRQVLKCINYDLIPKRICDGYTLDKKKKFKRVFIISKVV